MTGFAGGLACLCPEKPTLPLLPCRNYDESMSFSDTIFLFFLALILFGPKKLPGMARKAGKLFAELRRASNEFRSQIETEITQLEVKKNETAIPAPAGTVASLSVNPAASESIPHKVESPATLAAPTVEAEPPGADAASAPGITSAEAPAEAAAESIPASQESHA